MISGPSRALRGQLPGLKGLGSTSKVRNNAHSGDPRRGAETSSSKYGLAFFHGVGLWASFQYFAAELRNNCQIIYYVLNSYGD